MTPYSWFLDYLVKVLEKKLVSKRAVLTLLSVTPYSWLLGYRKGSGTKKIGITESSVDTALCDTIYMALRLS